MNGVIEITTGDLLRAGYGIDFLLDGVFNGLLELVRTDVPEPAYIRTPGASGNMHRWNGVAWIEVAQPPAVPKSAVFGVYDAAGGQIFTGAKVTVNLDTVSANSAFNIFSLAADVVTVAQAGLYQVAFSVSTGIFSGNNRSVSRVVLERHSGAGFVEVPGTYAYMYNRTKAAAENTGAAALPLQIAAGDQFRICACRVSGSSVIRTLAKGSRLTFELKE